MGGCVGKCGSDDSSDPGERESLVSSGQGRCYDADCRTPINSAADTIDPVTQTSSLVPDGPDSVPQQPSLVPGQPNSADLDHLPLNSMPHSAHHDVGGSEACSGTSGTGGALSSSMEERTQTRWRQEKKENDAVKELIGKINDEGRYSICMEEDDSCLSLGGRLQKYWCVGSGQGINGKVLLTVASLSRSCALNARDLPTLNTLLAKLGKHPLLHFIHEIRCYGDKVVIIQPLMEQGSLRDYLHEVETPVKDWAMKYGEKGKRKMKKKDIALCGRSILEAVLFLYGLGFPPVGHIQTGNIFKIPEGYKLGGYENTLLGYKSRYHHLCLEYGNAVDVIMLGHVIYEMASEGRELTSIVPDDDSFYKHVKDKEVKRFLKLIFSKVSGASGDYQAAMEELLRDDFFSSVPKGDIAIGYDCEITGKEKALLKEVSEGKEKQQKKVNSHQVDKEKFFDVMSYYTSKRKYYYMTQTDYYVLSAINLKSIGSRPGKFWGKAQMEGREVQLLSAAKVSKDCPILLTPGCVATIKKFFETSCKHPNLFPSDDVKFYSGQVLIVQEFKEQGSLKDLIYQTEPWSSWSEKSKEIHHGTALTRDQIQSYSKQILIACEVLYQLGFPQLGQIQSGNIFVEGPDLRLGGFENTLLGYSAVGSDRFDQFERHIDRIMFGRVVFEMGTGTTVESPIPTDADYSMISDRAVRRFTRDVFADVTDTSRASQASPASEVGWTKLISHEFLSGTGGLPLDLKEDVIVPTKMKDILKSVRKGRAKKQRSFAQASATLRKVILQ